MVLRCVIKSVVMWPCRCVYVALFRSRQSTPKQCNIHTSTRTLPIYAATSSPI